MHLNDLKQKTPAELVTMAEELGVDPGPALQELERRVLVADATLTRQPAEASGEAERSLRPRGAV